MDINEKFNLIGIFHSTLVELYGKEIADLVMSRVNEKVRALRPEGEEGKA